MITICDLNCKEENYTWWLNIMPDEMPRLSILPKELRTRLDFSLDSLDALETYIRSNYSIDELKDIRNRFARDLFARYAGETMRRSRNELYWSFDSENEDSPFYGIPVLLTLGAEDIVPPMTPTIWVMSLLDQPENGFLRRQLETEKTAA